MGMEAGVATNPGGGSNPSLDQHMAQNAIDGKPSTTWLDTNKQGLLVTFASPIHADEFSFTTAPSNPDHDPVSWRIDASRDCMSWVSLHTCVDCLAPLGRSIRTAWFPLLQVVQNHGFEIGARTSNYEHTRNVPSWTVTGSGVWFMQSSGNIVAPEGNYFLALPSRQCAISQSVPRHIPGMTYELRFQSAKRQDQLNADLDVIIDGQVMLSFTPASRFALSKIYYRAASEIVTIAFRTGISSGGGLLSLADMTIFLDQVLVVEAVFTSTTTILSFTTTSTTAAPPHVIGYAVKIQTSESTSMGKIWWLIGGAGCGIALIGVVACLMYMCFKTCSPSPERRKIVAFDAIS